MPDTLSRLNAALHGRYRIDRELGRGGMATVYLADDIKHRRKVALKVLSAEAAAAIDAERFLAEIGTTASLQHPHILPLFDSGEIGDLLFYVMPYVEGGSLEDRLRSARQPRSKRRYGPRSRSLKLWTTHTAAASSIATSSPRTFCFTTASR
jgi:eukaryotic-like serine/threonine-protein kinase